MEKLTKKQESDLIQFIKDNKSAKRNSDLKLGEKTIQISDSKKNEYFVRYNDDYIMVNIEKEEIKNYGDIFDCGVNLLMEIPFIKEEE